METVERVMGLQPR